VLLYYDRVTIGKGAYTEARRRGGDSSYHERVAKGLEHLRKEGCLHFATGKTFLSGAAFQKRSEALARDLLQAAAGEVYGITRSRIKAAFLQAYQQFVAFNRLKTAMIGRGEKYLEHIQAGIEDSRESLAWIRSLPSRDLLALETLDPARWKVFCHLVGYADEILRISEHEGHAYDPLIPEYLPFVDLVLRLNIGAKWNDLATRFPEYPDWTLLLELYRIQKMRARRQFSPPEEVNLSAFFTIRERYNRLRRTLLDVDEVLRVIPTKAAEVVKRDRNLQQLLVDVRSLSRAIPYTIWGVTFVSSLLSVPPLSWAGKAIGFPRVKAGIEESVASLCLALRRYGRVAPSCVSLVDQYLLRFKPKAPHSYSPKKFTLWVPLRP